MIHWCNFMFPTLFSAQESTIVFFLLCIVGNPLLRSNCIDVGLIVDEHLNILDKMTNNGDFFELSYLFFSTLFFLHTGVLSISRFPSLFFSCCAVDNRLGLYFI